MKIRIIPLVVATALFMENMDSTILATALPTIAKDLGVDPISLKLAITSYLVGLAIFIPVSSWVADRLGARTTFRYALLVFMAASVGCAFAGSLGGFAGWRFLQGVGGAMMTPVGRMLIVRTVPKQELVAAIATLTIPALVGPMLGPLIGGAIVTYFDWRWIFLVNIPMGIIGVILATRYFDDVREATGPLDWRGFALIATALIGVIAGATAMGRHIVPGVVVAAAFGVGALAAFAYVRHAQRVTRPLLDVGLFRLPTFNAGISGGSLFRLGVGASAFLLPLLLQLGFGYSPLMSGAVTFVSAVGAMMMKVAGERILKTFGFRTVLIWNAVAAILTIVALGFVPAATPPAAIALLVLMTGMFRSLQFTALHALSYADIEPKSAGAATSISSVAQQVSISLGVAIGALALEAAQTAHGHATPLPVDFMFALVAVSAASALCLIFMVRLPADAGQQLTSDDVTASRAAEASPKM